MIGGKKRLSRSGRSWLCAGAVMCYTGLVLSQEYAVWAEACLLALLVGSVMGLVFEDFIQILEE